MREVRVMLQGRNVDIHLYIDDWLIVDRNREKVKRDVLITFDLYRQLELKVNLVNLS